MPNVYILERNKCVRSEGKERKAREGEERQWRNALLFLFAAWDHVEMCALRGKAEGTAQ